MIMWKHYIVLFGGFIDPGVRTNYLQDLWVFDTQEYKWQQVEFKDNERKPSPRSGFSFLPVPEGAILHGGYCKEYVKGKRPQGIALDDTWLLKMDLDLKQIKWEKRKKIGYVPSVRSGCTMALWATRGIGVMFGGVYDDDKDEETLESVFYNDLYGYQTTGNGRWISLALKRPKKKAGGKKAKKAVETEKKVEEEAADEWDMVDDMDDADDLPPTPTSPEPKKPAGKPPSQKPPPATTASLDPDVDPDDPNLTLPLVRYNAMLAVLRNTLYIYGGIYERGAREYTLDDFYSLQLDKLDKFVCLKESAVVPKEGQEDESEEDDDDDEDGDDSSSDDYDREEDLEEEAQPKEEEIEEVPDEDKKTLEIRRKAQEFLQQANVLPKATSSKSGQDDKPAISDEHINPLPGETLAIFYARTKEHWASKARESGLSDNRGKALRRDGFALAEERWDEYKPILDEVERLRKEAGVDEDSSRAGPALKGSGPGGASESRNRR